MFANCSDVYLSSGVLSETPALLTRISILPYFSLILLISVSTAFASFRFGHAPLTSQAEFSDFREVTAFFTVSCLEPNSTTFAPFSRNFLTVA